MAMFPFSLYLVAIIIMGDVLCQKLEALDLNNALLAQSDSLQGLDLSVPTCPDPYIESVGSQAEDTTYQNGAPIPLSTDSEIRRLPILKSRILTRKGALKTTIEVTLGSVPGVQPGDAILVICPNPETEVNLLLKRLGIDGTKAVTLESNSKTLPNYLPSKGMTKKRILTECVDFRSPPKKQLLRVFAEYASDESEKRRLFELCSKEGSLEYAKRIREPNVGVIDVLLTFKSVRISFERLLEHLPRLLPRAYSLASSPLRSSDSLDIVFNVIEIPSGSGRVFSRKGICTGWFQDVLLKEEKNSKDVLVCLKANNRFRMTDTSDPIIMVGPGTGVSPYRGFLQHLHCLKDRRKSVLLFGCRNRKLDYIYEEELEDFQKDGTLNRLWTSFSRESDSVKYVQDNIKLHKEEIVSILLEENGTFYVCGDARNMAKQVNEVLALCISETLGLSEIEAKKKVTELMTSKRYLVDVW